MTKFIEIDINAVHESKHNPRRHFDKDKLKELAENIAQVGILTPLLVRPDPHASPKMPQYEIAAGHRRYRAAKMATLTLLPCLVRDMTDQELMELLNIENLQREGLHPLDEATGYEALMAAPYKMDVQKIADKVGRSVKYVYDRVKLLSLTKQAQQLFWAGKIDAGHAILLARLTPTEQANTIGTVESEYSDGGLFQREYRLYGPETEDSDEPAVKVRSVRELQAWIDEHIRFNPLKTDAMLFPETAQHVQTAVEGTRKIVAITHEYLAGADIRSARDEKVYGARGWRRADGRADSKTCDRSVLGVIVSGPGRGEAFEVCVNRDRCLVHWGTAIRARAKRAKERAKGGDTKAIDAKEQQAQQREDDSYAQLQRRRKAWEKSTPAIQAALAERLPQIPATATGTLGDLVVKALSDWGRARSMVPRGKTAEDLLRHCAGLVLWTRLHAYDAYDTFPRVAKALGLDLSTIGPSEPAQTSAVKKKGKGK